MSDIWEATKELLEFGFGWLFKYDSISESKASSMPSLPAPMAVAEREILPSSVAVTTPSVQAISPDVAFSLRGAEDGFVVAREVRVWQRPVLTFDGETEHLSYATPVEIFGYEGRFAHIKHKGLVGWLLKDEVTTNKDDIFPHFNTGEVYSANHPETKKMRKLYQDEFSCAELYLPLQDVEYISHVLQQKGKVIPWDNRRPRLSGLWQNLLKGKPAVQISISPKTGSVIEFVHEDGTGFVGYVESVAVDETITITGIGRLIAGEYRSEVVSKMIWQEWRPVFIQIV